MIPILYSAGTKEFTTNGLGRLRDAISCEVTEERNGTYELSMTYPISGIHYADIAIDRIIYAIPADGKSPQPFRIYKISKPLSGKVEINAEHISYLLSASVAMPFTASSAAEAMVKLQANIVGSNDFTFWTDKAVSGTLTVSKPTDVRSLLGGTSGSILDTYGTGEYEFDGFNVKLHLHRGVDNGVTIRYGKNMTNVTYKSDMSNVYTGIVPYARDSENDLVVTLPDKVIKSEHTGDFADPHYKVVDFSSYFGTNETPTEEKLRSYAESYVRNNEGWEISDNLDVEFAALWQTDEYKDMAIQRVNLCDTVHIIHIDLGINVSAEIIKTVYDVLAERYNSIEVGNSSTNLVKTITGAITDATALVTEEVSALPAAIKKATDQIAGGLGGYIVLNRNANGQPEELLIMDTDDVNTAVNVWRWNKGGLGHSHNGYDGPFDDVAITQDGQIVADYITSGTLDANVIKAGMLSDIKGNFYLDMLNGDLVMKNGDFQGKLTSDSGTIGGFTLTSSAFEFNKTGLTGTGNGVYIGHDGIAVGWNSGWKSPVMVVSGNDNYKYVQVSSLRFFRNDSKSCGAFTWTGKSSELDWLNWNNNLEVDGHLTCNDIEETGNSDERLKQDIETIPIDESKKLIMGVTPKRFRFKDRPKRLHHGLIAQDVLKFTSDDAIVHLNEEYYGLQYKELIADLINVVQNQEERIKRLEEALNADN